MASKTVTYNGEELSYYDDEQKLRDIERNIRRYKRQALTQEATGVDNTRARQKIGEWQAAARDFTKQTGITRDSAREYVGTSGKQPRGIIPKPVAQPKPTATVTPATPQITPPAFYNTLGNATTIDIAKQELSNFANYIVIPKDTDLIIVNTVTKELEALRANYNTENLKEITFTGRMSIYTGASSNFESLTINKQVKLFGQSVLQPDEWKEQIEKYIKTFGTSNKKFLEYAKYIRSNVCYKGREIETVIAHEYGHIIADQRTGQINGYWANRAFNRIDGNALYEKVKMIDNVYKQVKANGDIYKISVYASKDSKEFFAETFAMYGMQEETLPWYIINMIKEVLK
ncbi:phage minor capsid protein [Treponema pectinovorum]|uniref:phage minor capsid protein n=1 Tax=Treponema pectinovorum TaxID=164 RepID=UPI0021C28C66|nr:phage minor capsid protein [Treponema pectinovorum]